MVAVVTPVLIQMSGTPGAGKSTVAAALGADLDAIVIDHDVVKSALVAAGLSASAQDAVGDPENLADRTGAGYAAYAVAFALVDEQLRLGRSVVHDSPCYYAEILERGGELARSVGASYLYVECRAELDAIAARLAARSPLPTQCTAMAPVGSEPDPGGAGRDLFRTWADGMVRPSSPAAIVEVHTDRAGATADAVAEVRRRLNRGGG